MARKPRSRKAKIAVSIDAELYENIIAFVEATDRRGGVSGVFEDCVRWALVRLKEIESPECVSRMEKLENRLNELKWKRQGEMMEGEYDGSHEEEIAELEVDIAEEAEEIAVQEALEREERLDK